MRVHQQFDINMAVIHDLARDMLSLPPHLVEELVTNLKAKGYTVLKSSAYLMGIPQSITIIKETAAPMAAKAAAKAKEDLVAISKKLEISDLFQ